MGWSQIFWMASPTQFDLDLLIYTTKGTFQKRFSGIRPLRGYHPPPPLTENQSEKKKVFFLSGKGGCPPPLTDEFR